MQTRNSQHQATSKARTETHSSASAEKPDQGIIHANEVQRSLYDRWNDDALIESGEGKIKSSLLT